MRQFKTFVRMFDPVSRSPVKRRAHSAGSRLDHKHCAPCVGRSCRQILGTANRLAVPLTLGSRRVSNP